MRDRICTEVKAQLESDLLKSRIGKVRFVEKPVW
jgi:hypothetical protein